MPSSLELERIESCLMAAGVQAWNWRADADGGIKIRAYTRKSCLKPLLHAVFAMLFLLAALCAYYDVHTVIEIAQRWLGAYWR